MEDNHFIDQPYSPEEGYHMSKDLADQAIKMLRDKNATNPSKPFYMWFNPGVNHAPHHSPAAYTAKYKGKFDDGYDAYRHWVDRAGKVIHLQRISPATSGILSPFFALFWKDYHFYHCTHNETVLSVPELP
ncbi:sulfatase-like hydrolase/transferase [Galbibacter sp. PAP.153]|uniref:sulfatase-like hydrolase/transferase n=1 Tax=Galbibacter sp. PAP.153 TaxID=3104623 RepID=UPI003008EB80